MQPQARILVIDDNPVNLRLFTQMLEREGYKVQALMDGARALSVVKSTPPDLILLDLIMPGINGLDICRRIHDDEETRDIPILFVSALDSPEEKVSAFEAGAVDYITKPFRRAEVLARVNIHLELYHFKCTLEAENAELRDKMETMSAENAELRRRNQELLAYDVSVAHDLKNPISSILTSADWLVDTYEDLPHDDREMVLRNMVRTAEKASHIIESLLNLSQPGGVDIEAVDTESVISDVLDTLRPMIEKYKADIFIPDVLPSVLGDKNLLIRIWDNYLGNAIKYGGVPPKVVVGYEETGDTIKYWVLDNGQGIPENRRDRLFKPFSRVSNGEYVGHGLGLYLVQRSIRAMGGEVGMTAGASGGSRFFFTLPKADS